MKSRYAVVGLDANKNIKQEFSSAPIAAIKLGYNDQTFRYRMSNRLLMNGLLFIYKSKMNELEDDISDYFYERGSGVNWNPNISKIKKHIHKVPYQTVNQIVCITPCPYRLAENGNPRPKVGSSLCMSCTSFARKNKALGYVDCVFNKFGGKQSRTRKRSC